MYTQPTQRGFGRRKEDRLVRDLLRVGQIITSEIDMEALFKIIIDETCHIMEVEHCAIFVHDKREDELWSFFRAKAGKFRTSPSPDSGLAGWVFTHREPVIVNNLRSDPRFCPESGAMGDLNGRNLIAVPLINREKQCIGVYQAVNKKGADGEPADFSDGDLELFSSLSSFVVIATENSKVYEELKLLDKTKERVIHHISHEMKTPLTILSVALNKTAAKLYEGNMETVTRLLNMGRRNMDRLMRLQEKIDDIVNKRVFDQELLIMDVIEDAFSLVEILKEQQNEHQDVLEQIAHHIDSFYRIPEVNYENIPLHDFLNAIIDETMEKAHQRSLEILTYLEEGTSIYMDREILTKICAGLLKNAIENTPDEGMIEVRSLISNQGLVIEVRDYGVGITDENQDVVFGGFFHTQDTPSYSSKQPFDFNAGGSGADLLRIKAFSERLGFCVTMRSSRCKKIPGDADACPGAISRCLNKNGAGEFSCMDSGGSTFSVRFPRKFIADTARLTP
jgi:signal transduction histidine kinase